MRRTRPRQAPALAAWLRRSELFWSLCYALVLALLGSLIAAGAQSRPRYGLGDVVPQAIVPRVEFRAVDEQATRQLKEDAYHREPAVYAPNLRFLSRIRDSLDALLLLGSNPSIDKIEQLPPKSVEALGLTQAALDELKQIHGGAGAAEWHQRVERFINGLFAIPVLPPQEARAERDPAERSGAIVIQQPSPARGEKVVPDLEIIAIGDDLTPLRTRVAALAETAAFPPALRTSIVAIVMGQAEHTYQLDREQTHRRRQAAAEHQPAREMSYRPDAVLLPAGTRLKQNDLGLLAKEQQAYQATLGQRRTVARLAGQSALIALIALGLWLYAIAYNPRIAKNPARGLALTGLLLLAQFAAVFGTAYRPEFAAVTVAFPTLIAAIILCIAYDQRFALAASAILCLLLLVSLDLSVAVTVPLLAGVVTAIAQLDDVRTRSKLVIVGLNTGLAMALATIAAGLATRPLHLDGQTRLIFGEALIALTTGAATGLFTQGILPAVERAFKVTTAMMLKQLNDASHPLLQRLAHEAPGTYQHSLRIADMASAAAETIGANALLCQVGAMYHDVGKINKPAYFVENQGGGPNRHNKLSPAMSVLIIVGHVKDGVEMAREYGLPSVIRHFIESHHGTTLVEYFYHAARQKSDAGNAPAPTEFEFRYPGPKPQTREAAILMICDSVEGAARTLEEPTPVRLEQLVGRIASKRLMDGQFDECNLTLQELHKIEQAVVKTLCAIYHTRIKYPQADPAADEPAPRTASSA